MNNNNSKTIWIIIIVIVIVGAIYFITRGPSTSTTTPNTTTENTNGTTGSTTTPTATPVVGRAVFSATDAAANMGDVSHINMQVSEIDVHSATGGWVTASTTPTTFDLLALNAKKQSTLLANATIPAGTYDQIRLDIPSVSITTTKGAVDDAKLPSNEMDITANLVVNEGSTASANFDFLARSSLFTTDSGDYIFAPVVTTHTESNVKLDISTANVVTVDSGHIDTTNTLAMDIDGSIKANSAITPAEKLAIGTDGNIEVNSATTTQ